MRVHLRRLNDVRFEVENDAGATLELECRAEPTRAEAAFDPMEALLASLAGSTAADVVRLLARDHEPLTDLEVFVEGKQAETSPPVFREIHLRFVVHGNVTEAKARRAVDLSADKYSSVWRMLGAATRLTHSIELLGNA
jgi:putative redox protein